MTLLQDLEARVELGHLRRIPHETLPLTIYNYTDRCVWEKGWDDVTEQARGLVLDREGSVVARPFRKFFNLGERPETQLANLPAETPELSEKYDGSLIIAFYYKGEWLCCTRGSWESSQAKWAGQWLKGFHGYPDVTYLFELCAPWNRVVVPYGTERMILIGAIGLLNGDNLRHDELAFEAQRLDLECARLHAGTPADIDLAREDAEGEGYVALYRNGLRVKLKFATYLRLHKILTGLSVKGIWENLSSGALLDIGEVPDEFMAWYDAQVKTSWDEFARIEAKVRTEWARHDHNASRKDLALRWGTMESHVRASLFRLLDGKTFSDVIWKAIRPVGKGEVTFQQPEE